MNSNLSFKRKPGEDDALLLLEDHSRRLQPEAINPWQQHLNPPLDKTTTPKSASGSRVADLSGPEPVHIDAFGDWRQIDRADCAALVERTTGLPFREEHLAPVQGRGILTRTLLNLRGSYLRRQRPGDALWTVELALIVAPGDGALVTGAVALLTGAGRYAEAEVAATDFIESRPDDPAARALEAQLGTLSELRRRMN